MNALILVDIQNDFIPGGALAVTDGDAIIPVANAMMDRFDLVIATQDWHPVNHGSFAANHRGHTIGDTIQLGELPQILWPTHCVQRTRGAQFVKALHAKKITRTFQKGTDPLIDSYSGFFDNGHRKSTGLADYLRQEAVADLFIMGLATDYCVKFTALDAREQGFNVSLIQDGCRGVNLVAGDVDRAIEQMRHAGVQLLDSHQLLI